MKMKSGWHVLRLLLPSYGKRSRTMKRGRHNQNRQGLEGGNKGDSSVVDFMDLLAMISHQSPLATERYLADKVLRLQEQLNEAGRSVDLSSAASFADSTRLIQENELLQKRLSELSIQIRRKTGPPKVGRGSITSRQDIPLGGNPYQTDSLDEMLQQAAGLYSTELSESKEFAFSCFPGPPQEGEVPGKQESSLSGAFPPDTFPKDADMKAFEATDETGTWDSSHVRLLDTYEVDPTTKKEAKVEPRRLKLVEISTDAPEVVSHVPPRRVGPYSDSTERSESITISEVSMDSLIRSKRSLRRPSSSKSSSSNEFDGNSRGYHCGFANSIVFRCSRTRNRTCCSWKQRLYLADRFQMISKLSYEAGTLQRVAISRNSCWLG